MAKKFYYDSVGLTDLSSTAIKAGTLSSTTFSQSDSAITNEHYIKDQSIAHDIIAFSHEDAIRIDFGADVAVTDVFSWGFKGLNYHWGEMRQYTFPEVVGGLYKVDEMELRDLRTLPFVKILLNS